MRAIFISYRRQDAEGEAGRLFDDLVRVFGDSSVFMDVSTIEAGRDFRKAIDENVASCGVLLSVIGDEWLTTLNESGQRRLDDPADFVRLETASALKRDIPVIPVLVRGARMPRPEQLPDDLKDLAFRNAVELTHARWGSDVQLLIKAVERLVKPEQPQPDNGARKPDRDTKPKDEERKNRLPLIIVAAAAIVAALVGYLYLNRAPDVKVSTSTQPMQAIPVKPPTSTEAKPSSGSDTSSGSKPSSGDSTPSGVKPQIKVGAQVANPGILTAHLAGTCLSGYVWRMASPSDHVCVTPQVRTDTANDNAQAAARRAGSGPYGADTCKTGYVWRDAFSGDHVCVTPATRAQAAKDNQDAPSHTVQ